jgi:hypothetical protein
MVESLADDAQFVTVNGAWTRTRADYLDLMRRLHGPDGPFRMSTRETPEMQVCFLAPDVAMMHSRFHIYGDTEESVRTGIGTRVVRRLDGGGAPSRCRTPTCAPAGGTRANGSPAYSPKSSFFLKSPSPSGVAGGG